MKTRVPRGLVYLAVGFSISVSMIISLGGPFNAFSELIFHLNLDIQEWKVHLLILGLGLILWSGLKTIIQKSRAARLSL
ncbi:MAG: hypothetical protein O7B32_01510 [Thaumarchaeota archaeon]|nr:hypothetical protein [Nitrososphaerota archaeon]MCZ6615977.1 hypothetical protein [Nitrososphaerota archaeon]MCZ6725179.1 hypothetical protein [Nitrososphaerota archaeon]